MAISYDTDDLSKTLDKLEASLGTDEAKDDSTAELVKSLAEVAKAQADVAKDAMSLASASSRKRRKKTAPVEVLAKASKDEDEDDDDDDDEDDDDAPAWLKEKVRDGKSAGEMIHAYDRSETGTSVSKSMSVGGVEVVDVDAYLGQQLAQQVRMGKAIAKVEKLAKTLLDGLVAIDKRMEELEERGVEQARYTGVCAKALGRILEHREEVASQPTGSRYAAMEKSVAAAQREIDAQGGTVFTMTSRNKETLAKAVQTGKITQEQMVFIKRTERLPAGITLN